MSALPKTGAYEDAVPHVVIVGAGGSRAACPDGDKNGRRLPVMADLVDTVDLRPILAKAGVDPEPADFEAFYDDLATSGRQPELLREIENQVREYCLQLQLPDTATVYDYLLLSLRPKDLIATFNWDPLLEQAFRRHEGLISMPQLAYLHGSVSAGFCVEHKAWGWHDDTCSTCGQPFEPSPLLYPVKNKDYAAHPAIRSQWALLDRLLEDAYFLTIFGYSAPMTDAAAREAMLRAWSTNESCEIAEIELIDIRPPEELHTAWGDFIVRSHYITGNTVMHAYSSWHPRRSCDALFAATMMNDPWKDDWLPEFNDPNELRDWVDPLWREELDMRGSGKQFSGCPCREWAAEGG